MFLCFSHHTMYCFRFLTCVRPLSLQWVDHWPRDRLRRLLRGIPGAQAAWCRTGNSNMHTLQFCLCFDFKTLVVLYMMYCFHYSTFLRRLYSEWIIGPAIGSGGYSEVFRVHKRHAETGGLFTRVIHPLAWRFRGTLPILVVFSCMCTIFISTISMPFGNSCVSPTST